VLSRVLVVLATIAAILGTATAASAQTAIASDESPFRFQLEQSESPRGFAVEGYVYNALPWRITNVRVQVDSIDANGTLVASASGWVLGDVAPGGRGYFYVPVSAQAPTYRPSVQTFDKVMLEVPAPQAP
jgi:hypothetical protein